MACRVGTRTSDQPQPSQNGYPGLLQVPQERPRHTPPILERSVYNGWIMAFDHIFRFRFMERIRLNGVACILKQGA